MPDEILDERIRACRVVRWIRKRQDVFVRADWKTFDLPERGVFEILGKQLQVVLAARLITRERLPEAFNRAGRFLRVLLE